MKLYVRPATTGIVTDVVTMFTVVVLFAFVLMVNVPPDHVDRAVDRGVPMTAVQSHYRHDHKRAADARA
ncbi:hypothetical protein C5C17_10305 [Pseudoclavibacter sp. RFBA6]|nr:hypothetical protein C5C17_10305 [Pseudoclavibacter sp. RFBA6]